jgi:acyl-coenzyme A synthetase/AMP-(fatty) acid ligase
LNSFSAFRAIYQHSLNNPNNKAIVLGGYTLSYQALTEYIVQFAKAFEMIGVRPGMLIGFGADHLDKISELILMFSIQALGAVRVCDYSEKEARSACNLIFIFSPNVFHETSANEICLNEGWIESVKKTALLSGDYERFNAYCPSPEQAILFGNTSGTTGKKKYFLEHYSAISTQIELIGTLYFGRPHKNFISLYGANISAMYVAACATFYRGGTIIFCPPEDFLRLARTYPHSHALMLLREAAYFANMISEQLKADEKLSSIRVLGAHLPDRIRKHLLGHLSKAVMNSYSSNEAGQIAEILPSGEGVIYPNVQVRIVDDDWRDLAHGHVGQIAIKSSQQIVGYLQHDELNAIHFKDGWFVSNDVGYITTQGLLVYVDRADHMINLGGIKIPPKPFEDKLKLLPLISDCVLIGENTFFKIETLLVGIEAEKDANHQLLNSLVEGILRGSFAAYRVFYLEQFPRTDTGKTKRNELHKLFLKASAQ